MFASLNQFKLLYNFKMLIFVYEYFKLSMPVFVYSYAWAAVAIVGCEEETFYIIFENLRQSV